MVTKGEWYLEKETGLILTIPEGKDSPISVASVGGNTEPLTPKTLCETEANANLIVSAVNKCKEINPDNPQAVAESIEDVFKALNKAREDINWMLNNEKFLNPDVFDYIDEALAKAER